VRPSILVQHQVINLAQKQLRGQIAPDLSAEAAGYGHGLKRKLADTRGDVTAAALARDHKHLPVRRPLKHGNSLGEQKANVHRKTVDRCIRHIHGDHCRPSASIA
jgi:hypothetical protein